MPRSNKHSSGPLSYRELRSIVEEHLPAWFRACSAESDAIVMHETAFAMSEGDLFLFGCAIKYAAKSGKTVHVTHGQNRKAPGGVSPLSPFHGTYRENGARPVQRRSRGRP
jgi:hypothetical protein